MSEYYEKDYFLIRKKFFKVFGNEFHIYDREGNLVLYSKQKAFKLKEDIRLYESEDMKEELLYIQARQVIDFSASYDVYDRKSNTKIGALRRKGFKSIFKDEWLILDNSDNEIGSIKEDNMMLALIRRFLTNLIPQSYSVFIKDKEVAYFKQNFNPFILKLSLDFSKDTEKIFDRRLGIAAGILLCAIEGRQD